MIGNLSRKETADNIIVLIISVCTDKFRAATTFKTIENRDDTGCNKKENDFMPLDKIMALLK